MVMRIDEQDAGYVNVRTYTGDREPSFEVAAHDAGGVKKSRVVVAVRPNNLDNHPQTAPW
jgi:hypothetical protein